MPYLLLFLATSAFGAKFYDYQRHFSVEYDAQKWKIVNGQTAAWTQKKAETLITLERVDGNKDYHPRFSIVAERLDTPTDVQKRAMAFLESFRFRIWKKVPKKDSLEIFADQRDSGLTIRQTVLVKGKEAVYVTAATRTKQFESQQGEIDKIFTSLQWK